MRTPNGEGIFKGYPPQICRFGIGKIGIISGDGVFDSLYFLPH